MICDHTGCKTLPQYGMACWVLSQTPLVPDHRPLRMMTTLHFCELHKHQLIADDVLTPRIKAEFEAVARRGRPIGFKCDFEKSFLSPLEIDSPEYKQFLAMLGANGIRQLAVA